MIVFRKNKDDKLLEYNNVVDVATTDKRNLNLKIDKIFLNKNNKNYKIISMFLKNLSDDYYIRDITEITGCFLKDSNQNNIRSSFIDTYADKITTTYKYKNSIINSFLNDYNIKTNKLINLKESDLFPESKISNNLFLSDNIDLLDHLDFLNINLNTNWDNNDIDEMTLIKTFCMVSLIPILHHPLYLNIFVDTENDIVKISDYKLIFKDSEYKEHATSIIKKIITAYHKLCNEKLKNNKLIFFININYFEVNVQFYDKTQKNKSFYVFNFNTTDFFRLIRTFVGCEEYFLYDIGKLSNINDLTCNLFIPDKISYILEYSNYNEKERREDLIF